MALSQEQESSIKHKLKGWLYGNKEDIVKRLKLLLIATRAGSNIADLILTENQSKVIILFKAGGTREVNIDGDSGYAIIMDVLKKL